MLGRAIGAFWIFATLKYRCRKRFRHGVRDVIAASLWWRFMWAALVRINRAGDWGAFIMGVMKRDSRFWVYGIVGGRCN